MNSNTKHPQLASGDAPEPSGDEVADTPARVDVDPLPPQEHERVNRQLFAGVVDEDLTAVQRVMSSAVNEWSDGRGDRPGDMPLGVACCRVAVLALATIRRSAEYASEADWDLKEDEKRTLCR